MAGVLVARPGALARPSSLAELSCAPPTLRCCVEEGRRAAGPAGLWQGQVTWEACPVAGQGPGNCPQPSPSQGPSWEGSSRLPTQWGHYSRDARLPQTPKSPVPPFVCAHVRVCETACDWTHQSPACARVGSSPQGPPEPGRGLQEHTRRERATAPVSTSKERPRPPHTGGCGLPGAAPRPRGPPR